MGLYKPSQFNHKDYKELYRMGDSRLQGIVREGKYRDKKVQRLLVCIGGGETNVFYCPLEDVPLYLNSKNPHVLILARWRLTICK